MGGGGGLVGEEGVGKGGGGGRRGDEGYGGWGREGEGKGKEGVREGRGFGCGGGGGSGFLEPLPPLRGLGRYALRALAYLIFWHYPQWVDVAVCRT